MSHPPETPEQLATAMSQGDQAAEARFYERYYPAVLYLLNRRCGDAELAHDLAQEAFCVLLERLRREPLSEPDKVVGFLHSTAINLYIGEIRRQERRNTVISQDVVDRVVARVPSPMQRLLRDQSASAVRRLLASMQNERDRRLLYDYFIMEKDKEEICAEQALSQRHFDRVLFRAKQRFRDLLRPDEG